MPTRKLTVRLPEEDIEFAKKYASDHGLTLTQLLDRYLKKLRQAPQGDIHPDILRFSGIIPGDRDMRDEYRDAMEEKHR
ncbi:DUF6364 family protein [Geoalkalibacter halelectricus]|uniref:DUF6364 family protein n=1 Tax=Geoalkalibacter halelectricus TaxID=2847045 RepID=A0ABY5ZJI1_9BACT|nr:DUF6364 family protein [Geoalkalibacter halelectricus]MDO3379758.1 DUF6364 family protein [Geoalkalibacter halelectricus]UWZ79290.1 DUF6364 family protein [Geoalkalibacter halelectricus]